MSYPKKVQIETTNVCNLKCKGCLRENMTREKGFMNVVIFLRALSFCEEFGVKTVVLFNWGEPLLHRKIINFVIIAKQMGFEVSFTTNGILLPIPKLRRFMKAGLDKLDISYNKNSRDKQHLKNLYTWANGLGIETWFRSVIFSRKEYDALESELKNYNTRFQRGMYFDKNKKRDKQCRAIENLFVIQWDGTIVPCCAMYDNQYIYGKLGRIKPDELKLEIDKLKMKIKNKMVNCCNHCFEIEDNLPLHFKL